MKFFPPELPLANGGDGGTQYARATQVYQALGVPLPPDEKFTCCHFVCSVFALNAKTGKLKWRTPTIDKHVSTLSRCRVYVLQSLTRDELRQIVEQALQNSEYGLGARNIDIASDLIRQLIAYADGDARQALTYL